MVRGPQFEKRCITLWILIQTTKELQVFMELERLASYLERTDMALIPGQYITTEC